MNPNHKHTHKSFAFKQQQALGKSIANQLPAVLTAEQVAKQLGVSKSYVYRIERQALAKIACKLKTLMAQGEFEHARQITV